MEWPSSRIPGNACQRTVLSERTIPLKVSIEASSPTSSGIAGPHIGILRRRGREREKEIVRPTEIICKLN